MGIMMSEINNVKSERIIGQGSIGQYCVRQRELQTKDNFFVVKVMSQANGLHGVLRRMDFMPLPAYPDTWNLTYQDACDLMEVFIEARK